MFKLKCVFQISNYSPASNSDFNPDKQRMHVQSKFDMDRGLHDTILC